MRIPWQSSTFSKTGSWKKTGIKIAELLRALEKAADENPRATESWRWN
jgi:hypothetical protein